MNWDWEKLRENQQKFEKKQDGGGAWHAANATPDGRIF